MDDGTHASLDVEANVTGDTVDKMAIENWEASVLRKVRVMRHKFLRFQDRRCSILSEPLQEHRQTGESSTQQVPSSHHSSEIVPDVDLLSSAEADDTTNVRDRRAVREQADIFSSEGAQSKDFDQGMRTVRKSVPSLGENIDDETKDVERTHENVGNYFQNLFGRDPILDERISDSFPELNGNDACYLADVEKWIFHRTGMGTLVSPWKGSRRRIWVSGGKCYGWKCFSEYLDLLSRRGRWQHTALVSEADV